MSRTYQPLIYALILNLALSMSSIVGATVYKTTNADGSVSYSDAPEEATTGSKQETIATPHPTNTIETNQSQSQIENEFLKQTRERNEQLTDSWAHYESAMKKAKGEFKQAKANLANAKKFREGDRAYTKTANGGFSRETQTYKNRVSEAEKSLNEAQDALSHARKLKPKQSRPAKKYKPLNTLDDESLNNAPN